jgi:hypothetical protein
VGLLVIALVAQLAGVGFLLADYLQYPDPDKIPKVQDTPPSSQLGNQPAPPPPGGPGGNPPVPPGGPGGNPPVPPGKQ